MHIAQINVGRLLAPIDDPRIADFRNNLESINALAETSPGFVWRLKDDGGNATTLRAFEDPTILLNMSVWESPEALYAFTYNTMHRRFVQRRKEWFELFGLPYLALWWIADDHTPAMPEGRERLEHLQRFGPTAYAFNFKKLFPPALDAKPLGEPGATDRGPYRLCG
ncbi:MAG TPA: DUF3291 domain-containing protein [Bauldia sp.]|nr:DUF3291 domain-containing protein [Bauldia sp.]